MSENEQPDLAKALKAGFEAMGRVVAEWCEQWRPVFEQLGRPEVHAALEAMARMPGVPREQADGEGGQR